MIQYLRQLAFITLTLVLLYFGRVLFIPLAFAMLLSFIAYPVCRWLEKKNFNRSLAIGVSLVILLIPVAAIITLLVFQVSQIREHWDFINEKLSELISTLNLPVNLEGDDMSVLESLSQNSPGMFSGFISSATTSIVQILIIPFYVALILYHRSRLVTFLYSLFPTVNAPEFRQLLLETVTTYYNFVKGMVLVYLIVGILNSLGLLLLGIPNAFVFGFTAAILTFIPYIGIVIGSIMPAAVAWSMSDSITFPLAVVGVFTFVQLLEANFIFPLAVSHRIKVNTLVTLIAIFTGGILWGASGMILFIPFLAILKLFADKYPGLEPLRILLGTDEKPGNSK